MWSFFQTDLEWYQKMPPKSQRAVRGVLRGCDRQPRPHFRRATLESNSMFRWLHERGLITHTVVDDKRIHGHLTERGEQLFSYLSL